jgi:enoyl-CoA hydratase/carnithine racemase
VAPSRILATAMAFAQRLAGQPLGALIATKKLMRATASITTQMDIESREFAARLTSPEAQEAFMAFAQRRQPDFRKFA